MNLRVLQVVFCTVVWSILIGIGLFRLSPASAVVTPPVPQFIELDPSTTEQFKRAVNKPKPNKDLESRQRIAQNLTDMIWDTAANDSYMPNYRKNRNRGRSYSQAEKRLVVAGAAKQKKIKQLMVLLEDLSKAGDVGIQQVVKLIDLELEIIKNLLHRNSARIIQHAVDKRDALLEISLPAATQVYDMTLSLATEGDRKTEPSARTPFLRNMMERLEQYYLLIKNMQSTLKTAKR